MKSNPHNLKLGKATHHFPKVEIKEGKFVHVTEPRTVRILAIAEGWAMIRNEYKNTSAVPIKQLEQPPL